ncbi:MAG: hypothetical protein JSV61_02470 [Anaerolineales bacterium]|nr:MAG: hypothetical protein JSV61_02470 [Anaerolineales bacterium]
MRVLNSDQHIEKLLESELPEGCKQWTTLLLAKRLVELQVVVSISNETVCNLKKAAQALDDIEMGGPPRWRIFLVHVRYSGPLCGSL